MVRAQSAPVHVEVSRENQSSGEDREVELGRDVLADLLQRGHPQGRVEVAVLHVQHDPFLRKAAWAR